MFYGRTTLGVALTSVVVVLVFFSATSLAMPQSSSAENLKLTFDKAEDIPSAFFESSSEPGVFGEGSAAEDDKKQPKRIPYASCEDGSGGLCVPNGDCPSHLVPASKEPTACSAGNECCYGVPASDKLCGSRGGECVAVDACRKAPTVQGTDCSDVPGEVCCIRVK